MRRNRLNLVAIVLLGMVLALALGAFAHAIAGRTVALPATTLSAADEPLAPARAKGTTTAPKQKKNKPKAAARTTQTTSTQTTTTAAPTTTDDHGGDDSGRGRGHATRPGHTDDSSGSGSSGSGRSGGGEDD
jgi:Tfp pilus assembly protein FimT